MGNEAISDFQFSFMNTIKQKIHIIYFLLCIKKSSELFNRDMFLIKI